MTTPPRDDRFHSGRRCVQPALASAATHRQRSPSRGLGGGFVGVIRERKTPVSSGQQPAATHDGHQARLLEPGLLARNYNPMSRMGLVSGPVVHGLGVAVVYSAAN